MGLPKVERPLTIFNVAAPSAATNSVSPKKETVNFR